MNRKIFQRLCAFYLTLILGHFAFAQTKTIRIVTYNIEDDINGATTPLPGLIAPTSGGSATNGGVLEGIGEEIIASDPAQPLDILALEETTSNPTTVAPIVNGLNAFYNSSNRYAMSSYQATESGGDVADGNGPNAMVYNSATVQLVASVPVDPPGGTNELGASSGEYREVMRYEFAPAWATPASSNVFYIYVSHYKSGAASGDLTGRAGEAQIIRNDEANNLPATARVLYVGDYNIPASGETSYQTMLAYLAPNRTRQGQGIDPLNPTGATDIDWGTNNANPTVLAMETESTTDLRYRDDLQVMTSNVYSGGAAGLALVAGTYHTFGNNGTVPYYGSVSGGSDTALTNLEANPRITAASLYIDLTEASDHLPVVADYNLPFNPPTLKLGKSFLATDGIFQFAVTNSNGSSITPGQQYYIQIQVAANLTGPWQTLTNSVVLSNGQLQISDTNNAAAPRFYRAVEVP